MVSVAGSLSWIVMRSALPLLVNGLSCESSLTYMTASTQDCTLRCQHENWPPYICAQGKDHCPRTSQRRKQIKECFFLAAMQGCRPCVQHCIDVIGLDVNIQSDNKKYTVMDWSQWAVDKDVEGAQEVVTYLTSECHMDIHPRTIDPLTILQINDVSSTTVAIDRRPSSRHRLHHRSILFCIACSHPYDAYATSLIRRRQASL